LLQALAVVISFIAVVVLVIYRINYGLALLVGAVVLGLSASLTVQQFSQVLTITILDPATIHLAIVVSLISILARFMREAGMVDGLVEGIRSILSGRAVLAIIPALIGALPMPGGALLSAPLIDGEANRLGLNGEAKSFINVWFRHWTFFIYPLSSSLILAASLAGVKLYDLILIQIPAVLIYLLLGYLVSIRTIKEKRASVRNRDLSTVLKFGFNLLPLLLAVSLSILGVPMAVALTAGILSIFVMKRGMLQKAISSLRQGFDWRLPFAIISVMFFRHMLHESRAVEALLPYMEATMLPKPTLLIILAWVIGVTTAMPTAGAAIIFPTATIMLGSLTPSITSILYLTLVFSYIVSPMHLCLVLTVEYYQSRLQDVYRRMLPASLTSYLILLGRTLLT